ncbi:hypothetical protein DB30_04919 [Enhygromyxa salina]|uniref:Uncharacterized protein n=1 Tax=Enhygromyxa salina TaxID=215803 RepID=A0A0C2D7P8_9BACT|nr:hypothetical protein [Enhygromyxa salina]KIG16047.1 hypothetical protein DB30_04919 [Enhygromyxa salina]
MSNSQRGDHQNFNDGELEHEWAGGTIDLADERQSTSLREDPKQRKLLLGGIAGCVLLTVTLFGVAVAGQSDPTAEAPAPVPEQVEAPAPAPEQVEPVADPAAKPTLVSAKPTRRQSAGKPTAASAKSPSAKAAGVTGGTRANTAAKPEAANTAADSDAAPEELPDVEQWDDADDDALHDQINASAPM